MFSNISFMFQIPKSPQADTYFEYRIAPRLPEPELELHLPYGGEWSSLGPLLPQLRDLVYENSDCSSWKLDLSWGTDRDGERVCLDSPARRAEIEYRSHSRSLHFLSLLSESIGFHVSPSRGWRALYPNPCFHPQFGPGVAVASDGSRTVLLSRPFFGSEWMMVHRTNVVGPHTSAEVHPDEYTWVKGQPKDVKKKESTVSLAMQLLAQLQAKVQVP